MSFQTSALILSWVAILLLALVVSGLIRQVHALSAGGGQRPGSLGPPPGSPAPGIDLLAPDRRRPVVLLFLSENCRTCAEALDEAGRAGPGGVPVRALYAGAGPAATGDQPVPIDSGQAELFERYDVIVTPFAVVVDRTGRVVSAEPVGSGAALRGVLDRAGALPGGGTVPAASTRQAGDPT
jgi:hypothetical protein